jgi:hypothetical protein
VEVMKSMSAMLILAPKAVAVTDVDSDISIQAGTCTTVRRASRFGSVSDDAEGETRVAARMITARSEGCEKAAYARTRPRAIRTAMRR